MSADLARPAALVADDKRAIAREGARAASVPWYIWAGAVASTSAYVGAQWDASWHRSIGRDSFWTPAHIAIYACGVIAGIVGLYLVVTATWGKSEDAARLRAASVDVFGLRAPLGVFLAGWGGVAMLTAGPFDNWWHSAYGLDVTLLSPPHALLMIGVRAVDVGMLFLILAAMNRAGDAGEANFARLRKLFLYVGSLILGGLMFFIMEITRNINLHRASTYIVLAIVVPVVLATISQASGFRWGATTIAAIYTVWMIAFILIFPLFPAEPRLGPVYNPVTHMVPPNFPMLLIAPALALDLFWERVRSWRVWQVALVSGVIFVAVLVPVEWEFAKFLMSHASENRFFGTNYFDFNTGPDSLEQMHRFARVDWGARLWTGVARGAMYGAISSWVGLMFGRWMRGVQR